MEKDFKLISFVGTEKGDLPYYLARILDAAGDTVLVIDNSVSGDLYNAVLTEEEIDAAYQHNIMFVRNKAFSIQAFSKFNTVIAYQGYHIDEELLQNSDHYYLSTDYTLYAKNKLAYILQKYPFIMNQAKKALEYQQTKKKQDLEPVDTNIVMVYRDKAIKGEKESLTEEYIGLDKVAFKIKSILPLDIKDYSAYLELLNNGRQSIARAELSTPFLDALTYFAGFETGKVDKELSKLMKSVTKTIKGGFSL